MRYCRFVLIGLIALSFFNFPRITHAAGTVTDCSSYTAPGGLQAALTGDGLVTFACSGTIIVPEITITGTVTIDGTGQNVILSGNDTNRVFTVFRGNLTLSHITVANGRADVGGGIALLQQGTLSVTDSTITNNTALTGKGGGIYSNFSLVTIVRSNIIANRGLHSSGSGVGGIFSQYGDLTVVDSVLSENIGDQSGAIGNDEENSLLVRNSVFSNNSVSSWGGSAIYNAMSASIINCRFFDNQAAHGSTIAHGGHSEMFVSNSVFVQNSAGAGGGINSNGTLTVMSSAFVENSVDSGGGAINIEAGALTVSNSTFSGNSAIHNGGAISLGIGRVNINNSTFTGNSAASGGAIHIFRYPEAFLTLSNSILTHSLSGGDCVQVGASHLTVENTIISDGSCHGGLAVDPLLGPLEDNGATMIHMPQPGSPAIDAGDNATCETVDQLGAARSIDGDYDGIAACDMGAVEAPFTNLPPSWTSTPPNQTEFSLSLPDSTFSDWNPLQTFTASIDWGDGTIEAGVVNYDTVSRTGSVSWPSHVYTGSDGTVYTVTLTIDDNAGGTDTATFIVSKEPVVSTPTPSPSVNEGPSAEDNARAQAPLCADWSGTTNPIVRADILGGTVTDGSVFCRVLAQNSDFVSSAAEIGNQEVLDLGVIQAVDIFGMTHGGQPVTTFNSSIRVCLQGSGRFFFLDANQAPRVASLLPSVYENGYTCATIYSAGTVVLVR